VIWMSASTLAGGDRESYNLPAAAVALRPVGAAAPAPLYAAPSVGGMGYHEASSRASQPVWMGSPGRRRALSRRWRSSATVRGRGYRRPECAAASTDAGCAQAIVRPGEDCRRLKQCLMTPGTHGIFQC
jgi:hypothetical protein